MEDRHVRFRSSTVLADGIGNPKLSLDAYTSPVTNGAWSLRTRGTLFSDDTIASGGNLWMGVNKPLASEYDVDESGNDSYAQIKDQKGRARISFSQGSSTEAGPVVIQVTT